MPQIFNTVPSKTEDSYSKDAFQTQSPALRLTLTFSILTLKLIDACHREALQSNIRRSASKTVCGDNPGPTLYLFQG